MRRIVILFVPLLMAQTSPRPSVPEGIHLPATERPRLCGFTAATVDELQRKIMSDPSFREQNSNNRYRVFNREKDFVQFVFARPGFVTFPMATCVRLVREGDGTLSLSRELHCTGDRSQCDKIFIEWQNHDNRLRESLSAKSN